MKRQTLFDTNLEQRVDYNKGVELTLILVVVVLLAGLIGTLGWQVSLGKFPFQPVTFIMSLLVLVHGVTVLGWRRAAAFFGIVVVVSFLAEYFGVKTGLIFGRYTYTDVLHPKLLGTVPVVIPLAYFMVIYPSGQMANLMLRGRVNAAQRNHVWALYAALLTAIIMTAWDLVMDPVMVGNVKAWVWFDGGPYFGIPFRNFLGWTLTTFVCSSLYRLVEPHLEAKPYGRGHKLFLMLPILGYASLMVGTFFVGEPVDTRVIAPYAMGIPLAAALTRLFAPLKA